MQAMIACPNCGEQLAVQMPVQPQIINMFSVSLVVLEHPQPVTCTKCMVVCAVACGRVENVMLALVPLKEQPRIVVPPPGVAFSN